ncbi:MAG: DNA mismatch repair protein MutS, partial [Burkholderiales bacterium]
MSNPAEFALELRDVRKSFGKTEIIRGASLAVRPGERVAICDQLEDPAVAKGIVRRGVTELVTPGVSFNDNVLEMRQNNYLAAVHFAKKATDDQFGIAFLDVSTGEFLTTQGSRAYIEKLLQSFAPSEVLFCKKYRQEFTEYFGDKFHTFGLEDWAFTTDFAYPLLTSHFQTATLKGFGVEVLTDGIVAAGVILHYLAATEHRDVRHISRLTRLDEEKYVWLDRFTIRNLELVFPQQEGGVPLIQILDQTVTPMGARLLRKWIVLPLKDKAPIEERLNTVSYFLENEELLDELTNHLRQIGDLERLISKVAVRRVNPREMLQLKRSLAHIGPIVELLSGELKSENLLNNPTTQHLKTNNFRKYIDQLNACAFLLEKIETELREDPPTVTNQGGMIKTGVDAELDELHKLAFSGKDYLI